MADYQKIGRSERIRTSDPRLPKAVLYRTELHSDLDNYRLLFRDIGLTPPSLNGRHYMSEPGLFSKSATRKKVPA